MGGLIGIALIDQPLASEKQRTKDRKQSGESVEDGLIGEVGKIFERVLKIKKQVVVGELIDFFFGKKIERFGGREDVVDVLIQILKQNEKG